MTKRRLANAVMVMALAGAIGSAQEQQRPDARPRGPIVGRSVVATTLGIVAASQPLAARAGVQILERGGNAIDAAIAANATIGLMEPTGNGIGGDLFILYYEAKTGTVHGLNSSGWAPSGLTVDFLAAKGITSMPQRGIYSVTVPGVVAGWDAMRSRFGTKPFSELLAPAIHYAENGFPLSEKIAAGWANSVKMHSAHPNSRKTYLIEGTRAPKAGEVFKNPDLAGSLRLIAAQGRDGYYKGRTAEAILAISREQGGTMTAADLADFQPEWVTPIKTTYRGWNVYEIGPNTQGISALMMLNLMEPYPLGEYGFHSADALHVMIEAKKLAYADMLRYVGDPRFARIPVAELLSKPRAANRAKLIDAAKAACQVQPATLAGVTDAQGSDTIYMSVIDKDGNIVSLIQSNYSGFGSGLVPPGAGFMLHNRGGLFTLEKGQPNTLEPRKRPLHTIIPAFMEKGDRRIGFGIMGGWNQGQAHAQFVANIADFGMTIQQALEAGRFTKGSFSGCDVQIEELVPDSVRAQLKARGHDVRAVGPRSGTFGYGQAVMSGPGGVHFGASEPRHDGAAIPQAPPVVPLALPAAAAAQSPKVATYITDEQVKTVNALPGVDRQIISTDIGKLNLAVGIIHRGPTGGTAAGRGGAAGGAAAGGAARGAAPVPEPCGERTTAPPPAGTATGIAHDHQTETYIIVSGSGTLVTGGRIANGRKSAPDSAVTRVLNGPSCSGTIVGDDVVKKVVKTGDIIIIPAGVPHGWIDVTDHVDYLSVRPDPDRVLPADYLHPALKK